LNGWVIAGGLAAVGVGGFLWWRSRQQGSCDDVTNQVISAANASGYGYYGSYAAQGVSILCKLGGIEAVKNAASAVTAPLSALGGIFGGGNLKVPPECYGPAAFSDECKQKIICANKPETAGCAELALADTSRSHVGMTSTESGTPPPPAPILSDRPETRYTRSDGTSVVDYRTR
jgi:hypothetical protein